MTREHDPVVRRSLGEVANREVVLRLRALWSIVSTTPATTEQRDDELLDYAGDRRVVPAQSRTRRRPPA